MLSKIREYIAAKRFGELRVFLTEMNIVDIAEEFNQLSPEESLILFRLLPKETAADTFAYLSAAAQESLLRAMDDVELRGILDDLAMDDTVDMLEEMPASVVKRVLKNCDMQFRKSINRFLNYPEDSAGSLMTIEFVDLKSGMTVADAFDHIRRTGVDRETIYTCYVIDANRILIGVITVKDLLLADMKDEIGGLMQTHLISANTHDDREKVARLFDKYDFLSIPVVDNENRLVGIITVDDAMDALQQENTEDFEKMAALSPSEDSYLSMPVWLHARKRIVWLLVLMLSAALTGGLITYYEGAFAAVPLLVSFIPMLMDTGGNCGAQSSTLIIRGMALDELHPRDIGRIWFKEIRVALLVGVALSVVNGTRIWIQYGSLPMAITIALSLAVTVCIAKSLGCLLPIAAKVCHADPAIMASPLITTLVDTASIFVYFNVAIMILHIE